MHRNRHVHGGGGKLSLIARTSRRATIATAAGRFSLWTLLAALLVVPAAARAVEAEPDLASAPRSASPPERPAAPPTPVEPSRSHPSHPRHPCADILACRPLTEGRHDLTFRLNRYLSQPGGDWDGRWGLSFGITERVELATPGFVSLSLGDRAARDGFEWAVGGGVTALGFSTVDGWTIGLGGRLAMRRQLSDLWGWRAGLFAERRSISDTGTLELRAEGATGLAWSPRSWLSFGMSVGYETTLEDDGSREEQVFLGGRNLPLVSLFGMFEILGGLVLRDGALGGFLGGGLKLTL